MKKMILIVLIAIFFLSSFIVSFALDKDQAMNFTFHAGSIGGTYFIMGAAFTDAFEEFIEGLNTTVVPGGSFTNAVNVGTKGSRDMAICYMPTAAEAYEGKGEFAKEGYEEGFKNLRGLTNIGYGGVSHWVLRSNVVPEGIRTLGEFLENKPGIKVSVGSRGTGGEIAARMILGYYGVTYEDIENWGGNVSFTDYSDALAAIKDGHLDGLWNSFPVSHPGITELASQRDIELLSVDEEVLEIMEKEHNRPPETVPAGVYPGVDYSWTSPIEKNMVIVHKDLEDDIAYEMTKIILENKERWERAFIGMKAFEPSVGWEITIPLHPGAEKAFRELDYIK